MGEQQERLIRGEKGDKGERGEGMTRGARRAIVVLFTLTLLLAGTNLLFTTHEVSSNDRKFCDVVTGVTAVPVPKPPDPAANPSRETAYQWYLRFERLGRSLGC
jgi:hypothetical protein